MGGGGGKAYTPRIESDNLKSKQFYRALDLVSEGPIYGPVDQDNMSSFMLNKTQVTDASGNININGVSVAWRPGSENQEPIKGFDFIEATTTVNQDVKFDTPIVRTVTDNQVTRVRFNVGVSGLSQQSTKGDIDNTTVSMAIDVRPANGGWSLAKQVTITGKISGEFLQAHIIDAPDTHPFDIRVRRITADSTSDLLTNGTVWNSYTEITDDRLNYPFSAVVGAVIDHDQYADTPKRTYDLKGLLVSVPDNYDPDSRTYQGLWTGGFKTAWTDNPAWLFREIVTNTRYGLSATSGSIDVDDGSLYILSQYCDQMVDDGFGGTEPRLRLNAYITKQTSARDLLDSIAGMFRGIALWDGMRLTVMLDAPQDPIATITNANVVDGKFTRSSIAKDERYNAVVVSWIDPDNGWETAKEYVSDDDLIARNSYNETTIEAFGCTSKGQAWRAGKWLIVTANTETSKYEFSMSRDAIHFTPGDIVEIVNNNYSGTRLGGRILSHSGNTITVDGIDKDGVGDSPVISLMNSNGRFTKYDVASINGNVITLKTTPDVVYNYSIFAVSSAKVSSQLYKISGISETANNSEYKITAVQHNPNKQAIVDEGAVFSIPNDTLNGYRVPNVENLTVLNTNSETVQVSATWVTATTTKKLVFELKVYNGSNQVVSSYETDQFRYDFYGIPSGNYTLGVRGRNENGMKGAETQVDLIIGAPDKPTNITWTPGIFSADIVPVTNHTLTTDTNFEFWYSGEKKIVTGDIASQAQFLGRSYQWTLHGLKADTVYYVYVRTKNAFGYSDFVEVSGEASNDISGMFDQIDNRIRDSEPFKRLSDGVNTNIEGILQNALNLDSSVDHQLAQSGQIRADVLTVKTTVANNERAFAEYQEQVQTQFNDTTSAVNQKLTSEIKDDGTASAFYNLNLQIDRGGKAYNAGMAIGIQPDGSSYKSTMVVAADQFGVYSGSTPGNYQAAFFVYNGQVFINSAFIQDASITSAKIKDAAITNAKIGNNIQSNNYNGTVGWNLDKSTGFYYGESDGSGSVKLNGRGFGCYDANGQERAFIGKLS